MIGLGDDAGRKAVARSRDIASGSHRLFAATGEPGAALRIPIDVEPVFGGPACGGPESTGRHAIARADGDA